VSECRRRLLRSMLAGTAAARPRVAVVLLAFLLPRVHRIHFLCSLHSKIQPFPRLGYYGLC
jgi:hypothetical protein